MRFLVKIEAIAASRHCQNPQVPSAFPSLQLNIPGYYRPSGPAPLDGMIDSYKAPANPPRVLATGPAFAGPVARTPAFSNDIF